MEQSESEQELLRRYEVAASWERTFMWSWIVAGVVEAAWLVTHARRERFDSPGYAITAVFLAVSTVALVLRERAERAWDAIARKRTSTRMHVERLR